MEGLLQDIRYAVRFFAKSPGFTAVAVAALALGIGANTAIFSIVSAVLLNPYPHIDTDRWAYLWEKPDIEGLSQLSVSTQNYLDWKQQNTAFSDMVLWQPWAYNVSSGSGDPERVRAAVVTSDLFSSLHLVPAAGRLLDQIDGEGGERIARGRGVVVVTAGVAVGRRRLGRRLCDTVRQVGDDVEPRDALLGQQEGGVRVGLPEDRGQQVGAVDLVATGRLHMGRRTLEDLGVVQARIRVTVTGARSGSGATPTDLTSGFTQLSALVERVAEQSNAQVDTQVAALEDRTQRARKELLWWAAVALALRCVFEPVMVSYYMWPALAVALIAASPSWPRLIATSAAAVALTYASQLPWRSPWTYWAPMIAGLALTLLLAHVPARTSAPQAKLPGGDSPPPGTTVAGQEAR